MDFIDNKKWVSSFYCSSLLIIAAETGLGNMYTDNDILFPQHIIPSLKRERGPQWASLIEHIVTLPPTHEETLGLMLMMVRLNGCMPCETDSFRAMRGCTMCSQQTLRRFKGTDDELLEMYTAALEDIRRFAQDHHHYRVITES